MSAGWDSDSLEGQVAKAVRAQAGLADALFGPQDWEGFGKAVLVLCDSPFAEWNIAEAPGLTQAAVQVRALADRHGIRR